jgi:hypothetical protein
MPGINAPQFNLGALQPYQSRERRPASFSQAPTIQGRGSIGSGGVGLGANIGIGGGALGVGIGTGGISANIDIMKLSEALRGLGQGGQRGLRTPTDLMKETYQDPMFRASQGNAARGFAAAAPGAAAPGAAGGLSEANTAAVNNWVIESAGTGAVEAAAPIAAEVLAEPIAEMGAAALTETEMLTALMGLAF